MNILILGGGGREHALAWAVLQNPKCDRLVVAPGNAGIEQIAECASLDILDPAAVVGFADEESMDLVIVGPEAPLVAGVTDVLADAGIACFGPSRAAAQLEASKGFTKEICAAVGAPTAAYTRFDALDPALADLRSRGAPIVIKADGLAAGKGVTVAATIDEAEAALRDIFDGVHGRAEVVIEDLLTGEEASFFCLVDGETVLPLGTAQDHKRAHDGDAGPNTGGMGAYSPAPVMTPAVERRALEEIVKPCMAEMMRRGTPFRGVLFVGLMIEDGAPSLVEFNTRFGDPECQCLMMRLGGQVLDLLQACAAGQLGDAKVRWADDHAMCVVMAAEGYPGRYEKGEAIGGLGDLPDDSFATCFHAGTRREAGQFLSVGGRVLGLTARGASLAQARERAYAMVDAIDWPGGRVRRDIGWRALQDSGSPSQPT
ncbi:phosphoribosylamine--glycine ligase [Jannaschia aquimarina]|uniref:Phosphoribosylamine--glycine ligase n=1 Tax=Jannaschia aquimarina TaxID=935700 RepID=A0A0D1EQ03_9RHOB|nr:phosphoribosylamine--glycine ligase [Jannaschia aquimarina]KIT17700.1 Phosphoribosylamine--glycine ligase [Jannaschia aquimarina]SNS78726.1 phosphoribosylamine--glycine ligase [Jannaschia aquimarina]